MKGKASHYKVESLTCGFNGFCSAFCVVSLLVLRRVLVVESCLLERAAKAVLEIESLILPIIVKFISMSLDYNIWGAEINYLSIWFNHILQVSLSLSRPKVLMHTSNGPCYAHAQVPCENQTR